MALDASNFPMEGQNLNSEQLLPNVDFLLRNVGRVHRDIGGVRPSYVPDFGQTGVTEEQAKVVEDSMPSGDTTPDMPKTLKTPNAVMMPGSNTEPGKTISEEDRIAINNRIKKNEINQGFNNSLGMMFGNNVPTPPHQTQHAPKAKESITFFKDALGNQYKTIGDKLYVLCWQDSDMDIRLVSEKTNKVVPTDGKKFQIYGWHVVNKITDKEEISKSEKCDDVEKKLSIVRKDSDVEENNKKKTDSNKPEKQPSEAEQRIKKEPSSSNKSKNSNKKRLV